MDVDKIRELIELMVENDMSRIEIQEGDSHVLLRRGQPIIASAAPVQAASMPASAPSSAAPAVPQQSAAASPPASSAPAASSHENSIRSPMVGTFYAASDPESPPFVKVGDTVGPDTVVCLVEAMKVFNEIKAETSGRITRMLVSNGQAVEYDQPLFAIEPA
ncbi:MAG: acetyl-CoA carboxylase biotin carboxyl carrier protein [Phycisphaerae bacterium]